MTSIQSTNPEDAQNVEQIQRFGSKTWFQHWAQANKISYDYRTARIFLADEPATFADVLNMLIVASEGRKHTTVPRLKALLALWVKEQEQDSIDALRYAFGVKPTDAQVLNGSKELDKWVSAVCHEGHEYSKVILGHWLWSVKRKIANMAVTDALCPVLYGLTRGGKTTEIQRLLEPIQDFVANMTLDQVTDERHTKTLQRCYVIFVDEMAKGKHANLENLKKLVTAKTTSYRELYSLQASEVPVSASFIGATNKHVSGIIQDETSGARFWELRCKPILDWDALADVDRGAIWAGIDHTAPSPLSGQIRTDILALQHRKLRHKGVTEKWVDDIGLEVGENLRPSNDLYKAFATWCHEAGENSKPRAAWQQDMKILGFVFGRNAKIRGVFCK